MVAKGKDKSPKFLSQITESRLQNVVLTIEDSRTKLILKTLYETGCTVKELVELKPSKILAQAISFPKQNKPISEQLYKELLEFIVLERIPFDNYLFSKKNKPISPKRIEQLCKEAIGTSPKVLKDTYCINNIDSEKDFEFIVPDSKEVISKVSGDDKLELIVRLILEGKTLDEILSLKVTDEISFSDLKSKILREHNHRSEFLFSSRSSNISRRRVEQMFAEKGLKYKDVERILTLQDLFEQISFLDLEQKEWYEQEIKNRRIVVRRSGFLEVYKW